MAQPWFQAFVDRNLRFPIFHMHSIESLSDCTVITNFTKQHHAQKVDRVIKIINLCESCPHFLKTLCKPLN